MTTITLPLPPSTNRLWRTCGGRRFSTPEAKSFKIEAGWIAKVTRPEMLTGPICVRIDIYRARKAGDLDNFLKITLDAMQGILFRNDSQVVEIRARLFDDKTNPRVTVSVAEVSG